MLRKLLTGTGSANLKKASCIIALIYLVCLPAKQTLAQDDVLNVPTAQNQSPAKPSQADYSLTSEERWNLYWRENYASAGAFFRPAWSALWGSIGENPPEWGKGMGGYGRRLGSEFVLRTIQGSVEHGMAAALKTNPTYVPCSCSGFFPRLGYALLSNFAARREGGGLTFNLPNVTGIYGSSMISMSWYPERYSYKDGFRNGNYKILIGGSFNIAREFWPELSRIIPFAKKLGTFHTTTP